MPILVNVCALVCGYSVLLGVVQNCYGRRHQFELPPYVNNPLRIFHG